MSESMIERVARALSNDPEFEPDDYFKGKARAAIEAMREPTEAMLGTGDIEIRDRAMVNIDVLDLDDDAVKICWQAMIDAALSEKPQDITVACKCGWQGRQSELNGNLCPKCSAPFKAVP